MRVVITGGRGQLAADLIRVLDGEELFAFGHQDFDVTNVNRIRDVVREFAPTVVINTAAFHNVDQCESSPESSFAVNAAAPQRLAAACAGTGALLVHFSTDYVFDGQQRTPYPEGHPVNPLSVYGVSKAAGEMAIRSTWREHLIVRTTGLYGIGALHTARGNFVERMLALASENRSLTVVSDQVLTPSYTLDVAETVARLIGAGARGTFHVTNSGECSWFDFARSIFDQFSVEANVSPVAQRDRPVAARRPPYSVLQHAGLRSLGLPEPRPWQDALAAYLSERRQTRHTNRTGVSQVTS